MELYKGERPRHCYKNFDGAAGPRTKKKLYGDGGRGGGRGRAGKGKGEASCTCAYLDILRALKE